MSVWILKSALEDIAGMHLDKRISDLRENGLWPSNGRGRGKAPPATAYSAALGLLAVMADVPVPATVMAVRYAGLHRLAADATILRHHGLGGVTTEFDMTDPDFDPSRMLTDWEREQPSLADWLAAAIQGVADGNRRAFQLSIIHDTADDLDDDLAVPTIFGVVEERFSGLSDGSYPTLLRYFSLRPEPGTEASDTCKAIHASGVLRTARQMSAKRTVGCNVLEGLAAVVRAAQRDLVA